MNSSVLESLLAIAGNQKFDSILEEIKVLQSSAKEEFLDVVVLGQFKAGKSSFLNKIFKKDLLPVGVVPVTAVVTRVFYGAEEKATVTFQDGNRKDIPASAIFEYVTEKDNPENKKSVYLVDITLPGLKAYEKLRFIDTPGLGSVFQHNSEVTENWFNKIGAALVVISAAQPLSEKDISLIQTATRQSPEVHLVLSKTDLLNTEEVDEVKEFLTSHTKDLTGKKFDVFPYSTKVNTAVYQAEIENSVLKALSGNFSKTRENIFQHKLTHLLELTKSFLEIQLSTSNKKDDEMLALKNKILDEQLKLSFIQKELAYITKHYQDTTRIELEREILDGHQKLLQDNLEGNLVAAYKSWNGNLNKVSRKYESWLRKNVEEKLGKIEFENRPVCDKLLADVQEHFDNYCLHFRERLNHRIEEVLHVKLPKEDFKVTVEPMARPDIRTSWAFESHIDLLWFLIPMPLLRNTFLKSFLRQLPGEAEKNLRRLVAVLTKNINRAMEQSHSETSNYIRSRLQSIEQLLDRQTSDVDELKADLTEVETLLSGE